jgi:hypothetical protein
MIRFTDTLSRALTITTTLGTVNPTTATAGYPAPSRESWRRAESPWPAVEVHDGGGENEPARPITTTVALLGFKTRGPHSGLETRGAPSRTGQHA